MRVWVKVGVRGRVGVYRVLIAGSSDEATYDHLALFTRLLRCQVYALKRQTYSAIPPVSVAFSLSSSTD